MIEKINLETLEITSNMVLVKIDPDYDFHEVKGPNGNLIVLQLVDFSKTGVQIQSITGTVLKAPELLSFHVELKEHEKGRTISDEEFNSLMRTTMPHDVPMDVSPGDKVVFDVKHALDAEECGLLVDVEGVGYAVFMTYEALYCKEANDKIIPLNGWVIFLRDQKPGEWQTESGLFVIEKVDKYGSKYATIIHYDAPVREYIEKEHYDPNIELKHGDRVLIQRGFGHRMADDSFAGKLKGMEVARYRNLLAFVD